MKISSPFEHQRRFSIVDSEVKYFKYFRTRGIVCTFVNNLTRIHKRSDPEQLPTGLELRVAVASERVLGIPAYKDKECWTYVLK